MGPMKAIGIIFILLNVTLNVILALAQNVPPSSPALVKLGKASYAKNCASCHGNKGDGKGSSAAGLKPPPRNFLAPRWLNGTDLKSLFDMITNGVPGGAMVSFSRLPESERWALACYIKSLAPSP